MKITRGQDKTFVKQGGFYLQDYTQLRNGYIIDGNYTANSSFRTKNFTCNPGDVFKIGTYLDTQTLLAKITYYNASGVYVSQVDKGTQYLVSDYEVTIPDGVYSFSLTAKPVTAYPSASLDTYCYAKKYIYNSQTELTAPQYQMQVNYDISEKTLLAATKYDENYDMVKSIAPAFASLLPMISDFYKIANKSNNVSGDFASKVLWYDIPSDFIGPYYNLKATSNIDGDATSSTDWTGGAHGYVGDQTGTKTASNVSMTVYIDNRKLTGDYIGAANEVKVVVVNKIQATNTKVAAGTGREVLQEKVTYIFKPDGSIDFDVEIEPLEAVTLARYYGIQTCNANWNSYILYVDDSTNVGWFAADALGAEVDSSSAVTGRYCHEMRFKKGNDRMIAWLDSTYGLGTMYKNTVGACWTATYGKSYFRLLDTGASQNLAAGEILRYRGGYKFYSAA